MSERAAENDARREAWDEGYAAARADQELLSVYPDMGRRLNPYRDQAQVGEPLRKGQMGVGK